MTEYEKCLQGLPFDGAQPPMSDMLATARRYMKLLRETDYDDRNARDAIFKELFGAIGTDVYIDVDFHCEYGKHIFIGNRTIINQNCTFIDNNYIRIGSDVLIASNVQIYTATHSTSVSERIMPDWAEGKSLCRTIAHPVTVGDGAWLGGGVIVLPGVTIGAGAVIGAGSVVTRDIPDNAVAVGNPCRVIKINRGM